MENIAGKSRRKYKSRKQGATEQPKSKTDKIYDEMREALSTPTRILHVNLVEDNRHWTQSSPANRILEENMYSLVREQLDSDDPTYKERIETARMELAFGMGEEYAQAVQTQAYLIALKIWGIN
jgi:hypothetical protein